MTGQPPQLRDQAAVRSFLRVGGPILFGIGLLLTLIGIADFFGSMNRSAMPSNFWMAFIGLPLMGVGGTMMRVGYLGPATRYVAGEVAPTIKDALSYVGVGGTRQTCAACGGTSAPDATFCDDCGAPLGLTCASCGQRNDAAAQFCDRCGKPLAAA